MVGLLLNLSAQCRMAQTHRITPHRTREDFQGFADPVASAYSSASRRAAPASSAIFAWLFVEIERPFVAFALPPFSSAAYTDNGRRTNTNPAKSNSIHTPAAPPPVDGRLF